jgi:hypothetical protein
MQLWQQSIAWNARPSRRAESDRFERPFFRLPNDPDDGDPAALFSLDLAGCSGSALRSSSEFFNEKGLADVDPNDQRLVRELSSATISLFLVANHPARLQGTPP